MNFCKNCKYLVVHETLSKPEYWECNSPKNNKGESPLTGEPVKFFIYCDSLRKDDLHYCGLKGNWFEGIDVIPE